MKNETKPTQFFCSLIKCICTNDDTSQTYHHVRIAFVEQDSVGIFAILYMEIRWLIVYDSGLKVKDNVKRREIVEIS